MSHFTKIDFINTRKSREKINRENFKKSIICNNIENIKKYSNYKKLRNDFPTENKFKHFIEKCKNDNEYLVLGSKYYSKNASRQGNRDEDLQIEICKNFSKDYNIFVSKLGQNEAIPTINGLIKNRKDLENGQIYKSFDAKISGEITAYMICKVVFGKGGHQDNVIIEIKNICEWVKNLCKDKNFYVVLIETDLNGKFLQLKNNYKDVDNLIISNHYDFQVYVSNNFSHK